MVKSREVLKKHQKFACGLIKRKNLLFSMFIFDQIIFLITTIIFILKFTVFTNDKIASYIILVATIYLLLKFTYVNWFSKNVFYKSIIVFKKDLKVDKLNIKVNREISFMPLSFIVYNLVLNLITAVYINVEINSIFTDHIITKSFIEISMNMLLLPSFLNTFNKMIEQNKSIDSNYIKLIKDQYYSNENLFEDVEFRDDCLNLTLKKVELTSKNGIFIFKNKKDLTKKEQEDIENINKKILEDYKKIWSNYYDLLQYKMHTKFSRKSIHTLFWLERIYDHIFIDFLDIE